MDALQTVANLATFASGLAAFVAILVAIRTYKRQTNAQVFLEYTARFENVMAAFPVAARLNETPPVESEQLTYAVLRYLNLCSEEFYLWRRGYLSQDVWSIWEAELIRTLGGALLKREWKKLRDAFQSYPEFQEYVEAAQRDSTTPATPRNSDLHEPQASPASIEVRRMSEMP